MNLSNQEILQRISRAFHPHQCTAETWDYDQKLRIILFDSNDRVLFRLKTVTLESVRTEQSLADLCEHIRHMISG